MVTVPKWQEPLVAQAEAAERTLRAVMHAPGGGAGAMAAAAAADQDLAELCRAFAARSGSPLLQRLLMHGARALDAHAGVLLAATIDPDELVVPAAPVEVDEDQAEHDDIVEDEDQALVEPTPEPAATSGDAPANAAVVEPAQASPELVAGTRVEIVGGTLLGRAGVVADPPEVEEYAGEEPGARVWVETAGGDRVSPLVTDLRVISTSQHDLWQASLVEVAELVEHVRMNAGYWHSDGDNDNAMSARRSALVAVEGINQCMATLERLRAELVAGVARAEATDRHAGGAS
ncbi:hypothetical protein SAMN04488074_105136 [Lentzea albidocapillata subsp. violacea]|uniref:Uncharacterized protein n=1 Tax=Lentzea albidocapillata subsp. violacea TaxID=128104 RepID=A0A1G9AWB2_9PSEU|nr:hypothetical protein [Lentzea albidocapillata]SDK31498.1 hypothetical protein SAMN04488074_105136 [Lentzea albidocapillata subsp. violacea]